LSALPVRRWLSLAAVMAAATLLAPLVPGAAVSGASAAPKPSPTPGSEGKTPPLLRDVIERTSRAYVEAKSAVVESQRKQLQLRLDIDKFEKRRADLIPEVSEIARHSYMTGRIGPALMLLNSADSSDFLRRAQDLETKATFDSQRLQALGDALEKVEQSKTLMDIEVKKEKAQLAVMAKQKVDADNAFKLTGGRTTNGYVYVSSPVARQSPKGNDGGWPSQSCSEDDPTTGGCITPRLKFALKETQRLGFERFVSCFRSGGPFEHPKGRACDFSAFRSGFGSGDAGGQDKFYGNNLAAFFVRNADRLGVLYVIWYRQIWLPATGWKSYGSAGGDPSSDHTNHVHLSVL
jgi:peptidoglycan DL-endopeptidase CwlO